MEQISQLAPTESRSSNRSFGLVFAFVFGVIAAYPVVFGGNLRREWAAAAALFLLLALLAPAVLAPLNRWWFRLGLAMHKVVNPVVMALIFVIAVIPTGLLMRLFGKDPLRLRREPAAQTYWIPRDPPGPAAESLKNQF
jgi:hypothetical protein